MKYVFLALAIITEVIGSGFLNASKGFSKPIPTVVTIAAYLLCFFFLAQSLKYMPLGIVYAIWAGLGIVLTAVVSIVFFKQSIDAPAVIGMILILLGVVVINVFSKSSAH